MKKLNRLLNSLAIAILLMGSSTVYADYCDGPNYCRTDNYGNAMYCNYAPDYCGYGANVFFGFPLFFGGGGWDRGHHEHGGGGHWEGGGGWHGGGGHGGGGEHHGGGGGGHHH